MTSEMLTTDEIKGLVKLVKDWETEITTIYGRVNDDLMVAIDTEGTLFSRGYRVVVARNVDFIDIVGDTEGIYASDGFLGTWSTPDKEIENLYNRIIQKKEDVYNRQHAEAVENARRILREQH